MGRFMLTGRVRIAAVSLLAGSLAIPAGPAASVPAETTSEVSPAGPAGLELRIVEYNICGSMCEEGWRGRRRPGPDLVGHVRDVIVEAGAHLVVLNEICHAHLDRLYQLLEQSGHPMRGAFHAQRTDDRACPPEPVGQLFGDAVLSTGPVEAAEVHPLRNRGEQRSLLCLPTSVGRRLVVCALHLEANQPGRNQSQFDDVVEQMRRRLQSETVVLAGDFNRVPSQMGRMTDPDSGGAFLDVDAEGNRATHYNRRIDYILLDRRAFSAPRAEVHDSEWSDHRILIGHTTLRPAAG